jgi:hypothetical protein
MDAKIVGIGDFTGGGSCNFLFCGFGLGIWEAYKCSLYI